MHIPNDRQFGCHLGCTRASQWPLEPLGIPTGRIRPQCITDYHRACAYLQIYIKTSQSHKQWYQGLYSLSGKTSYRKISWSLEAARFGFRLFQSLWNLAGTSAAALPRCLSNVRAILPLQHPISRLRDFTRFGGKTSYLLVNRGLGEGVGGSTGMI